ncbi:hypothetical protein K492DRAFT_183043 [Lichtheimia hyalospora FSU 10163]|nr:hypothetical protein K492DRAFT_183043 [Lichtheimia hyalospora FSU 10163]
MANPTCCCCFSLRCVNHITGDLQWAHIRIMTPINLVMLIVGLVGAWKRKASYIRISALYELALFTYNMGDITYDLVTTSAGDICKGLYAAKETTDSVNAEEFCESHIFFYMFLLVFVFMMGPFIILDLMLVITLYRYASYITNQEYSEQQRYALPSEKSEGVSSASLTTRIFLRKRAHQSVSDNQANPPTV